MTITEIPQSLLLPAYANTHPCFFRHGADRIMTYRHEPPPFNSHTRIAIAFCDDHWMPFDGGWIVKFPLSPNAGGETVIEDCRLFHFNGEVYFTATDRNKIGIGKYPHDRPLFAWINVQEPKQTFEKNWEFFQHGQDLYGVRWITPREIYRIKLNFESGHECEPVLSFEKRFEWAWGIIHGGTCPVRYGNLMVSMFHSFTIDYPPHEGIADRKEKTEDPQRKINFAAPYAFRAEPPFDIVMVPTQPMIWPQILPVGKRSPNKDLTVFPVGLIRDGDNWICGYGDDRKCFKVEFTTAELFEHLEPLC